MAERSSLKPAAVSFPTLTPQGQQLGKPAMALNRPFTLIGARNRAHLHLVSSTVSRSHACVISTDNGLYVRDLASRTGAIVNGRRVKEADLRDGDTLQIGSFKFKFSDPAGPVRFPLTPKAAAAVLDMGGTQTPLDTRTVLIGRRVTCDIPLTEASVSNTHALIFEVNGHRFVRDLGSRTGTLVNGKPIHHQLLEFGDEIRVGETTFHYASADEEAYEQPVSSIPEVDLEEDLEPIGLEFDEPPQPEDHADSMAPIPLHDEEPQPVPVPVAEAPVPQGPISVVTASHDDFADLIPLEPMEEVRPEPQAEPEIEVAGASSASEEPSEHSVTAGEVETEAADSFNLHLDPEPESINLEEPIPREDSARIERPREPIAFSSEHEPEPAPEEPAAVEPAAEPSPETHTGHFFTASGAAIEPVAVGEPVQIPANVEESVLPVPQPVGESTSEPSAEDDAGLSPVTLEELARPQPAESVESEIAGTGEVTSAVASDERPAESSQPQSATVDLSAMHFEPESPVVDQGLVEAVEPPTESDQPKPLLDLPPEPTAESQTAESTLIADPVDLTDAPVVAELASPTLEPALPKGKRRGRPPKDPTATPARRGRKRVEAPAPEVVTPVAPPPAEPDFQSAAAKRRPPSRRKRPAEPTPVTPPADEQVNEPPPSFEAPDQVVQISGIVSDTQSVVITTTAIEPEPVPDTAVEDAAPLPSEPAPELTPDVSDESPVESYVTTGEAAELAISEEYTDTTPMPVEETSHITADDTALEPEPVRQVEEPIEAPTVSEPVKAFDVPAPADIAHEPLAATDDRFEKLAIPLVEPATQGVTQLEPEAVDVIEPQAVSSTLEEESEVAVSHLTAHEVSVTEPEAAEVVEETQPDPDSAQVLEPTLDEVGIEEPEPQSSSPADWAMSDTAFGRVVEGFAGPDAGSLVEETSRETAEAPAVQLAEVPAEPELSGAEVNEPESRQPDLVEPIIEEKPEAPAPPTPSADAEARHDPEGAEARAEDFGDDSFDLPEVDFSIDLAETEEERGVGFTAPVGVTDQAEEDRSPGPDSSVSSSTPLAAPEELSAAEVEEADPDLSHDGTPAENESHSALFQNQGSRLSNEEPERAAVSPVAESQAPIPPPPPQKPAMDPFFGMSRDLASFIGGAPLVLSSAAPTVTPPRLPAPPLPGREHAGPPSPPASGQLAGPKLDDPIPEIDFTLPAEESLDLFEDTPEKLDAIPEGLAPIGDVTGVLSTPQSRHPLDPIAPPTHLPKPPVPPGARAMPFRQVSPPPPPRSSPLRSLTAGPQAVAPPPNFPPVVAAPPFAGLGTPQKAAGGFGSPGAPPIREVDVFSHTAFPPLDPTLFGAPQRPATPPHPRRQSVAEPSPDAGLSAASRAGAAKEPVLPNRQVASTVAATTAPPPRRRWWRSMKFLLPLMIVAIVVVIAMVMLLSNHKTLEGSLQMQGVDPRGAGAHERANELRALATSPRVVQLASSGVRQQNLSPGFLDHAEELATIVDRSRFSGDGGLAFRVASRDPEADKVRLASLLNAVYAESGAGNDAAASHRSQLQADQARLEDFREQRLARDTEMKTLAAQLAAMGTAVPPGMDPAMSVVEVATEDQQRQRDLNDAAALVKVRREALADAQAQAAKADANAARTLDRVRQSIAELNVRLDAVKLAQGGQSDEAARRFDAALDVFRQKLDAIPADGNAATLKYRSHARDAMEQIRAVNTQLSDRERQDRLAVNQLRSQIDDRREAHLTRVWAGDVPLQQMAEERNAQAHRYATALDSGYGDEAVKIQGVLEDIDHKIDARRSALATGAPLSDELQRSLQTAIDRMESDRLAGEQQMAAKLKELQPTGPEIDAKIAGDLNSTVAALTSTRQAYASASSLSASEAQDEARKIESRITEQQARLDTLRQGNGSNDPVQLARAALDQAQAAEEKAATAYAATHGSLGLLRQYADARGATMKLDEAVKAQAEQVKLTQDAVSATPTVIKPDESSVKLVAEDDRRVNYLITGIGAVVILFGALMWFSGAPEPVRAGTVAQVEALRGVDEEDADADHGDAFADEEHPIIA